MPQRTSLRLFFLLVLAVIWGIPLSAHATFLCPFYTEPEIIIKPIVATPRLDTTQNLKQIQIMSGKPEVSYAGFRELPVGLTAASLRLDSNYNIESQTSPSDHVTCAQVSQFELAFGYDNTTVFLARELPPYSCSYSAVLEHENRHVEIDRQILNFYYPQLKQLLADTLRRIGVLRVSDPSYAQTHIRSVIDNYLEELSQTITAARREQQQRIDTRDEYQRLSKSCDGELLRIVGDSRGR